MRPWFSRFFSPISLVFIPLIAFFAPLFLFGKIFVNGDVFAFSYPMAYFFSQHFGAGVNQYFYMGYPLAASFHYAFFSPLYNFFYAHFNYLTGYHLILLFDLGAAIIATYLLARKLTLSPWTSVFASGIYAFSQFSIFWIPAPTIANSLWLLPALILAVHNLSEWKQAKDLVKNALLAALIIGWSLLTSHYQFVVMMLVPAGAYLLLKRRSLRTIFTFSFSVIGGFLIGLPQWANVGRYFGHSGRVDYFTYEYLKLLDPIKYFFSDLSIPRFTLQEFLPYIGMAGLALLLVGLFYYRRDEQTRTFWWLLLLSFSFMVSFSPVAWLARHLPVLERMAEPVRFMYLASLCIALISAFALEKVCHPDNGRQAREFLAKYLKYIAMILASLVAFANLAYYLFGERLLSFANNYFDVHYYASTTGQSHEYYYGVIRAIARTSFGALDIKNISLIAMFVSLILLIYVFRRYSGQALIASIALISLFDLSVHGLHSLYYADASLLTSLPEPIANIAKIEPNPYTYRIASILVPDAQYRLLSATRPEAQEEAMRYSVAGLVGDVGQINNLPVLSGLEATVNARTQKLTWYVTLDGTAGSPEEKIKLFLERLNILSALNVKYVVSPYELNNPSLTPISQMSLTSYQLPLYLYQNQNALPRIYVPERVDLATSDAEAWQFTTENKVPFNKVSFVECPDCLPNKESDAQLINEKFSDDKLSFDVTVRSPSWVIVINANVLGWQAYIDGQATRIYSANYASQAVQVPVGKHHIKLEYKVKYGL